MDRELSRDDRVRMSLRRWLPGILLLAAAGGGLVWAIGLLEPSLQRRQIRTGRVERGPIEAVVTGSGTAQPAAEQVVSSPIESRVVRVLQRPGAVLEAGEAILELDVAASELSLEQLVGQIDQNQARREELELELQEALLDLESRREIKGLDVEELEYLLVQRRELFDQGLVAESLLRQTETQVKRARIELRALGDSIAKARQVQAARLANLDAARRTLERELQQAREQRAGATIRSERAGVLTSLTTDEGVTVARGQEVARVADLDRFRLEAVISDIHAGRLQPGQEVRAPITETTMLDGRVERILPAVESGTLRFWVALDDPGHTALRANLRTDVLIVTARKPSVLTLAKGPYANGTGEQEVFVVDSDDHLARRRTVRFGLAGYKRYEVLEGLDEGDEVILTDVTDYLHMPQVGLR
ncbi:MAG: HlyD family efflux transporter periplasmic adaptor subunit [Acidobacteriota bacterium]